MFLKPSVLISTFPSGLANVVVVVVVGVVVVVVVVVEVILEEFVIVPGTTFWNVYKYFDYFRKTIKYHHFVDSQLKQPRVKLSLI